MFTTRNTKSISTKRRIGLSVLAGTASTLLVVAAAGSASAATDGGSTTGNVAVDSSISMTGLVGGFTLTGIPGATPSQDGAVTFNVETNNLAGYAVTVQSATDTLIDLANATNPDSIPIGALSVRQTNLTTPGAFSALSSTGTVTVHSQDTRSAEGGDDLSNDYQVVIPFVNQGTYTATLDYVAGTL
ncbi:MAG: hypothetical protein JWR83_1030 [Aeromicrobium sp.]|nr:hypothetical protein [Aeromicrobium sp.]